MNYVYTLFQYGPRVNKRAINVYTNKLISKHLMTFLPLFYCIPQEFLV